MPQAGDISFIRKLCALGLPAQILAQCLLPELRKFIPSHSAGVFWVDRHGEMTSLYAERMLPPQAMAVYHAKYYSANTERFANAFLRRAELPDPISFHSFSEAERETPYFRDVMQPLDAYHVLYGIVKDGATPLAQISFYRGRAAKPFNNTDASILRSVIRYLGTGLLVVESGIKPPDATLVVEEELGIVTLVGMTTRGPDSWHRLLRLAALQDVSPRNALKEHECIHLFVRHLCEELIAKPDGTARRELIHETRWGRFAIRAFPLNDGQREEELDVALLIRREEPRSLSLVRGTAVAGLSPQQREVALLIAAGKSNREIGSQLGLAFNTASSHVKHVYTRLGVNERSDVAQRLLHLAQSALAP